MPKEYWDFQARHQNRKVKQFSKKAWSIIKGCAEIECDRLIWIDADTIIKTDIPDQLLNLIDTKFRSVLEEIVLLYRILLHFH